MKTDSQRLRRVRLIERMRSTEHQQAAAEAHRAEMVRQKLETLSERTRSLAQLYALRDHAGDGADLRNASLLSTHMAELGRTAEKQASEARTTADARMADLAVADRRLRRAEDNRRDLRREITERQMRPEHFPAKRSGTVLE